MSSDEKTAPTSSIGVRRISAGTSQMQRPSNLGSKFQAPLNRPPSALPAPSRQTDESLLPNPASNIQRPNSSLRPPSSRVITTPPNSVPTTQPTGLSSQTPKPVTPQPPRPPPDTVSKEFQEGTRVVCMKKHVGTISFAGKTSFADGIWYGVTLDEANGKNNGSVQEKQYFQCEPNCGLFVRVQQLMVASQPNTTSSPQNGVMQINVQKTPNAQRGISQIQPPRCATPTNRPPSASLITPKLPYNIGDKVIVGGKKGVVRYIGRTQFAKGMWTGVELDSPGGKNNGNIEGVKYFTCAPKHGLFAPASKVLSIPGSLSNLQTPPQQQQPAKKTPASSSSLSSNNSLKHLTSNSKDRPSSRASSSSLSSSGKSKRADPDMELEGQISGLMSKLEEVNSEKSMLEDILAGEKNLREDLQFSLDEQVITLEADGPRTPGIFREKKQEVEILQGTIRKLEQGLAQAYAQYNTASSEIEELRDSLEREKRYSTKLELEKERGGRDMVVTPVTCSLEELEGKKGELERANKGKQDLLRSLSQREEELKEQVSAKREADEKLGKLEREVSEHAIQMETLEGEYRDTRISLEAEKRRSLTEMNSVGDQKRSLEQNVSSLRSELATVREEMAEKDSHLTSLNRNLNSKNSQIEDIQFQFQEAKESFHVEREGLQAPVTELQERNASLEGELDRVKRELREFTSIRSDCSSYELKCAELEKSLRQSEAERETARESLLKKEEECFGLQEQLDAARLLLKQKEEENKQQQDTIRELEASNQRKMSRLDLMEQTYLQVNGEIQDKAVTEINEDPLISQDYNLNALSNMSMDTPPEDSIADSPPNCIQPPSRLYCDICEKFDSHDTEDCPIQNDSPDEFQTPRMVSGYSERPYCDICEIFGHSTEDCDSQVTF